jgi:hypothetical protein
MPEPLKINGKARTAQNLQTADDISGPGEADKSHPAATPTYPQVTKPSPSSYAPSGDSGPRVYGTAPVSTPILSGGK